MNVVSLGGGGGDAAISTIREGKDETCDVDDDGGMESLSNNDHNHQKKGVHNSNNNDNDNHNHNDMDEEEDEDDNESMDMDRGVNRRDEINRAFPSQPPGQTPRRNNIILSFPSSHCSTFLFFIEPRRDGGMATPLPHDTRPCSLPMITN